VLAENPAIEVASNASPFEFTQWNCKASREIPCLRVWLDARLNPATVKTGYAEPLAKLIGAGAGISRWDYNQR
jgi:hypothetical protein